MNYEPGAGATLRRAADWIMVAVLALAFTGLRYRRSAGILGLHLLFVVVRSSQIEK